eukprot:4522488-Amphidinium_carterae.2
MTSVASQEHFPHIPLKPLRSQDPHTLTAENGEQINIYGIKEVILVYQNIAIPTTFIISDVNCAILGLDTITNNNLSLRVQDYQGHLSRDYAVVRRHYIGNHFYLKATVFDGLYDYVDYTPDFTNWYCDWYGECDDKNTKVYGLLQDDAPRLSIYADYIVGGTSQQEAHQPKAYKAPTLPTQQEIDEHNLKSQHHQQGGLTKQSITQIDYAFLKSDNDNHNATMLTICESIAGLGFARVVYRKGATKDALKAVTRFIDYAAYAFLKSENDNRNATVLSICDSITRLGFAAVVYRKGATKDAVKAVTRYIVENGLRSTILQTDGEPTIVELATEATRQLPYVKMQTSPTHSHQSQGVVERYHQTLFAQLRTVKFDFCQRYNIEPRNINSHSPLSTTQPSHPPHNLATQQISTP